MCKVLKHGLSFMRFTQTVMINMIYVHCVVYQALVNHVCGVFLSGYSLKIVSQSIITQLKSSLKGGGVF